MGFNGSQPTGTIVIEANTIGRDIPKGDHFSGSKPNGYFKLAIAEERFIER